MFVSMQSTQPGEEAVVADDDDDVAAAAGVFRAVSLSSERVGMWKEPARYSRPSSLLRTLNV